MLNDDPHQIRPTIQIHLCPPLHPTQRRMNKAGGSISATAFERNTKHTHTHSETQKRGRYSSIVILIIIINNNNDNDNDTDKNEGVAMQRKHAVRCTDTDPSIGNCCGCGQPSCGDDTFCRS